MTNDNIIAQAHELIKDGMIKAAAAQLADAKAAQDAPDSTDTTKSAPPPPHRQQLTLVPYTIVKSLSLLDNIYETRLFGWLIAKAQSVLKLYNKDLSDINIEHAMDLTRVTIPARFVLVEGDKNYSMIRKAFTLADKTIDYTKDNILYHLNIIAFPKLIKEGRRSTITFVIANEMWHALLDFSKGYRLFSFETFMRLQSKYSVIMYLLCTQQSAPKNYGIDSLKQLLGCDGQKAYDRGANFFARVIDPAHDELKAKAPWYFEYSATKDGRSHKYTNIIITPVLNKSIVIGDDGETVTPIKAEADKMRIRLDRTVIDYCIDKFGMETRAIEHLEPLLTKVGNHTQQLSKLEEIRHRCLAGQIRNPAGYLTRSLQNMFK